MVAESVSSCSPSAAEPQPKKEYCRIRLRRLLCGCGYALPAEMFFQVRLRRLSPQCWFGPHFRSGGRSPKLVGACLRKGRATSSQQFLSSPESASVYEEKT